MPRTLHVQTRAELDQIRRERFADGWSARPIENGLQFYKKRENQGAKVLLLGNLYVLYRLFTGARNERRFTVICSEPERVRLSSDGRHWSADGVTWHDSSVTPPPETLGPTA